MNILQTLIDRSDFPFNKDIFLKVLSLIPQAMNVQVEKVEREQNPAEDVLKELNDI
jgi:hypothetical protein